MIRQTAKPGGELNQAISGGTGRLEDAVLSDRETRSLEAEVEAHEKRIDVAVFALYGVEGLAE